MMAQSAESDEDRRKQHRLVQRLCYPGNVLHVQFRQFLNGEDHFLALPLLAQLRGPMKFTSILEREIETKHQLTQRVTKLTTNAGGAYVSIGHRKNEVTDFLNESEGNLNILADQIGKTIAGHHLLTALNL